MEDFERKRLLAWGLSGKLWPSCVDRVIELGATYVCRLA
jgi:hypothetical protein